VAVNPNGRVPAVIDPNNNITVWESGAIIEYLVDTYDKEGKLTVTSLASKWQLKQYLHFQMSGQGPYFGQCLWFYKEHHDDQPSAKERYAEHTIRVVQVFENIIKDKTYLVDDKVYVTLSIRPR
jgi:glutathione S-transferase